MPGIILHDFAQAQIGIGADASPAMPCGSSSLSSFGWSGCKSGDSYLMDIRCE
jgi:hypothetical protein